MQSLEVLESPFVMPQKTIVELEHDPAVALDPCACRKQPTAMGSLLVQLKHQASAAA